MIAAVLSLVLANSASSAETESLAAVDVFRQACIQGSLKLSKDRAQILEEKDVPNFADVLDWNRPTANRIFVKFSYPRSTYLAIADYLNVPPRGIVRECILVSGVMSKRDAAQALIETTPDIEPKQTWWPNMYFPEWTVDLPEQGFRKRLRIRNDGSVLLEIGLYNRP